MDIVLARAAGPIRSEPLSRHRLSTAGCARPRGERRRVLHRRDFYKRGAVMLSTPRAFCARADVCAIPSGREGPSRRPVQNRYTASKALLPQGVRAARLFRNQLHHRGARWPRPARAGREGVEMADSTQRSGPPARARTGLYARSPSALQVQRCAPVGSGIRKTMPWLEPSDIPAARAWSELEILGAHVLTELEQNGLLNDRTRARK